MEPDRRTRNPANGESAMKRHDRQGAFFMVSNGQEKRMTGELLKNYRESIDNIDAALVFMLAERFKITQAVGQYKARAGLPPADPMRERDQVARLRQLAESARLDPDFTEKFLRFIIHEVIRHHENANVDGENANADGENAHMDGKRDG